jgi:ABC-type transport system involved in multi-copper enzyme maturation permease subunit
MIRTIWARELLDHLHTLRFALVMIVAVTTMVGGTLLYLGEYKREISDYRRNVTRSLDELRELCRQRAALYEVFSFNDHQVYRRPNHMAFMAEGGEGFLPNSFTVNAFDVGGPFRKLRLNPFVERFKVMDWAFLVGVIMSFSAVVLSYDAISGERERGTLRLLLSNPISKATILIGKYLGVLSCLIIALLAGLILSLLVILLSRSIEFGADEWSRVGMFALLSVVYLSTFVWLSLFVSSLVDESSTGLMILLLVWAISSILLPNTGGVLASGLHPLPSSEKVEREMGAAWERAKGEYESRHPNVVDTPLSGRWSPRESLGRALTLAEAIYEVYNRYLEDQVRQAKLARRLISVSPTALYTLSVEELVWTGMTHYESFLDGVRDYRRNLKDTLLALYPFDPDIFIEDWNRMRPLIQKSLDYDSIPKFEDNLPRLGGVLDGVMVKMSALLLLNGLFFMLSFLYFFRRS